MGTITTHALDTATGRPARGLPVRLDVRRGDEWVALAGRVTDDDGRVQDLLAPGSRLDAGIYRLTFATGRYFAAGERTTFFPEVAIAFEVRDPAEHHHVPLLLSPFGYATYRGS